MTLSQAHPDQLPGRAEPGRIIAVPPDRLAEAVDRLVAQGSQDDRAHANRFLEYARSHAIRLDAMWSLLDASGGITSTVLAVPSPGRTAMLFASHPRSPAQIVTLGRLMNHACEALAQRDIHLAQTLLDPSESLERQAALAGQFLELAYLSYLERAIPRTRASLPVPSWPAGVDVIPYRPQARADFLQALEASYEQTLDCPGLLGLRETDDILEGHRASGRFDPGLWTLLRVDGRNAGVLLLNPSAGHGTIELVYLGLAPQARGRGLARKLLAHGLQQIAGREERCVNLAVDEANAPALRLYRMNGFRTVLRRMALIRSLVKSSVRG